MIIRKAEPKDLDNIDIILLVARVYMHTHGNATQWAGAYPDREDVLIHMEKDEFFVGVDENDEAHMCFALCYGPDPTYSRIDGAWLNDRPYGTIHMVASDGKVKGCGKACFDFAKKDTAEKGCSLRIDTHNDNAIMNTLLKREGFAFCGVIKTHDGTPRNAYQFEVNNIKSKREGKSMANRMMPINGASKAKRILWGSPQNYISWAYMKEVREHHPCKVYDCNPYVEVYQFRDNVYGLFNQNCDGAGDVWMWLTVGPEKCLLVDTAYGLGDSKGIVDQISGGKEIIVVNTHDHFDHAFGNCRFGRAYCHEALLPLVQAQNEHMWDYLFDKDGNNIWLDFDREDLPKFEPYEIIGVPDGYTWDLGGGYEIELINCNGHGGPGSAMYLDKQNRILFAGDNICSDTSGCGNVCFPIENSSLYKFSQCVNRLAERLDEFDYLFPEHFITDLDSNLILDFKDALDAILKDPYNNYDYELTQVSPNGGAPRTRRFRYVNGFSCIAYSIVDEDPAPAPAALRALTKK